MADRPEKIRGGNTRKRTGALRILLGLLAVVGLALAGPTAQILVLLAICLLMYLGILLFFTAAMHEAGHLLAGWLVGFRFEFVTIAWFNLGRKGKRIRPGLVRGRREYLGLAGSYPTDGRDLRRRTAIMIVGGPLASLSLALAAFAAYAALGDTWLGLTLDMSGAMSSILFLMTVIPSHAAGFASDGAKLILLLRGGATMERYCAIAALAGMSMAGRRGCDLPSQLVEMAIALPDGSGMDGEGAMFAYYWSLDRGDVAGAASYLDRALAAREKRPAFSRPGLYREAAYFFARHREDAPAARAFLMQSTGGLMVKRHNELRAESAVLLAEGKHEESLQRASEGLATLRRPDGTYPSSDAVDLLQDIATLAAHKAGPTRHAAGDDRLAGPQVRSEI